MKSNFIIFNIPHSSTNIPKDFKTFLNDNELKREIFYNTDWFTNDLIKKSSINVPFYKKISEFSRLWVDVEKLPDEQEECFKYGRGVFYTKTFEGKDLNTSQISQERIDYYNNYQSSISSIIDSSIKLYEKTYIIDLHSFDEYYTSFFTDIEDIPDICLGVNKENCDVEVLHQFKTMLEEEGYKVKINFPYSGSYLPLKYTGQANLFTMMIEINKKLYLKNDNFKPKKTEGLIKLSKALHRIINSIFS